MNWKIKHECVLRFGSASLQVLFFSTLLITTVKAANTWDGGGSDDNWSTAENWDDDQVPSFPAVLTFGGTTRLAPSNDLSGVTVSGITFASGAGAFTLEGNAITLDGNINASAVTVNQVIDIPLDLNQDVTLTSAAVGGNANWTIPGALVINSVISGPYGVTTAGKNYVQLNGINTYSGDTIISGGDASFSIGHPNALGTGRFIVGSYSGESQMWIQSCGNQTITNDVEIRTGRFISVGYTVAGRAAGNLTLSGNILMNQPNGKDIWNQRTLTFSGTVSGGNLNGLRMANGKLVLQGSNTFTNNLLSNYTKSIPTFNINSDAAMGHTNNGVRAYNNSLIFQTADNTSITLAPTRFFRSDAGKILTFDIPATSSLTVPGEVYGDAFVKTGSGSLALTGVNTCTGGMALNSGTLALTGESTYTGGTTVNGGILNVTTNAALGDDSSVLNFSASATLQAGATSVWISADRSINLTNAGTYTVTMDVPTNYTMTVESEIKANVATNISLTKTSPGTLVLTGGSGGTSFASLNMLGGKLSIQSGVWSVAPEAKDHYTVFNVLDGATYEQTGGTNTIPFYSCISQKEHVAPATTNNSVGILSGGTLIGYELMVGRWNSAVMTISGDALLDLYTLKLGEDPGFTTVCNLNGGVITCAYIASRCDDPSAATSILNLNGGTIRAKGDYNIIGSWGSGTVSHLTKVNVKSGGAIIDTQSNNGVAIPQILEHDAGSGTALDGGLTKIGSGTLTLNTNNTYNGVTAIDEGTLTLGLNNALLSDGDVHVGSGAVFNVNNKSQTIAVLGGGGTVQNNAQLTVTQGVVPGGTNEIGTLTLAATPAFLGGSFQTDIADDGSCDKLHVQGDLDISSLSLNVPETSVFNKYESYVIVSCTGTLSGTFSSVTVPDLWTVKYDTVNKQVSLSYNFGTVILIR